MLVLMEEGLDIGVCIGNLPDSSMLAVRVSAIRYIACPSWAYIAKRGTLATPQDLAALRAELKAQAARSGALASQRPGKLLKEAANRRDGFPPSARLADARRAVSREQQIS